MPGTPSEEDLSSAADLIMGGLDRLFSAHDAVIMVRDVALRLLATGVDRPVVTTALNDMLWAARIEARSKPLAALRLPRPPPSLPPSPPGVRHGIRPGKPVVQR